MANIYPPTAGIEKLKETNVSYWQLCISRSKYTEDEINNALDSLIETNYKLQEVKSKAYDLLIDEDGEMNTLTGFATSQHKKLYNLLTSTNYNQANMSQNSHLNCFPVATWNKETDKLNRKIARIEKTIAKFN